MTRLRRHHSVLGLDHRERAARCLLLKLAQLLECLQHLEFDLHVPVGRCGFFEFTPERDEIAVSRRIVGALPGLSPSGECVVRAGVSAKPAEEFHGTVRSGGCRRGIE